MSRQKAFTLASQFCRTIKPVVNTIQYTQIVYSMITLTRYTYLPRKTIQYKVIVGTLRAVEYVVVGRLLVVFELYPIQKDVLHSTALSYLTLLHVEVTRKYQRSFSSAVWLIYLPIMQFPPSLILSEISLTEHQRCFVHYLTNNVGGTLTKVRITPLSFY